jgi:hypothetical protein
VEEGVICLFKGFYLLSLRVEEGGVGRHPVLQPPSFISITTIMALSRVGKTEEENNIYVVFQ